MIREPRSSLARTDAFDACSLLGLYQRTGGQLYLELVAALIRQGKYRVKSTVGSCEIHHESRADLPLIDIINFNGRGDLVARTTHRITGFFSTSPHTRISLDRRG
jgi:hypothetical protein